MAGVAPHFTFSDMSRYKVAVISARWHEELCNSLVSGAQRALSQAKVSMDPVIYVPGSFELPLAAKLRSIMERMRRLFLALWFVARLHTLIMSAKE